MYPIIEPKTTNPYVLHLLPPVQLIPVPKRQNNHPLSFFSTSFTSYVASEVVSF